MVNAVITTLKKRFFKKGIGMKEVCVGSKGLDGIVVGDTALSLVDGQKGILIYCGYNIDQLASKNFTEICHLFLYGHLPNKDEEENLKIALGQRYTLPKDVVSFLERQSKKDHPMGTLRTAVSMLSGFRSEPDLNSHEELVECAIDLIAKTGTIVSAISRIRSSKEPLSPDANLSFADNFLYMSTGEIPEKKMMRAFDTALILHMDHGFNASTFTARVVTSSLSDMISAVTAAIGSLKGPLHGGANTAVMKMLKEIGSVENVEAWLSNTLTEKKKVMGFGHRVYKVLDPRAKHLKRMSQEWGEIAKEKKWFQISEKLEKLMLEKKGLNANVDFYSASTYYTMGIEPEMYTPIFAVARMVGWTAHVIEQLKDNRIMRPSANYIGPIGKML